MCVSVSPGVAVNFSDTILYGAEISVAGETRHVLGYQNRAQNRVGASVLLSRFLSWMPWRRDGNAMILPFPAVAGTMTAANVLDTKACRHVLQDMAKAVEPPPPPVFALSALSAGRAPRVQVFDAAGIYTVVLAQDARDIPEALEQVPRAKRPALNPELFDAYATWYPRWTIALCCFNNRDAKLADPMLWWYRPMDPDRLFLPALDCHTGETPDIDALVPVDHVVVVSSDRMSVGSIVEYRDTIPASVAPYVPSHVIGGRFNANMPNGDFVLEIADVRTSRFAAERERPPGAS